MAKTKTKKSGGMSGGAMMAIGATAAALGAGAYYLMGPDGKKHQQKAATLYSKMKKEVSRELKRAKNVTTPIYNGIVDNVTNAYQGQYEAHEKEIRAMAKKMKDDWKAAAKSVVTRTAAKKTAKSQKRKK